MLDGTIEKIIRFNGRSFSWKYYYKKYGVEMDIKKYIKNVIPSLYEYKIGYNQQIATECIPFPINSSKIEYKENIVLDKIVIFHGLSREVEKGTSYIEEALKLIAEKYKNVEVIIEGKICDCYFKGYPWVRIRISSNSNGFIYSILCVEIAMRIFKCCI